jgi:hypothetical protein
MTVRARRNRSLTREEVEAFWKQRGEETPFGSLEKTPASSAPARGGLKVETSTTGGARRGVLPARRRQPQHEPRLVDAEQVGVPQRAAAGGRARPGAELRAAVPRRADRHHRRRLNPPAHVLGQIETPCL